MNAKEMIQIQVNGVWYTTEATSETFLLEVLRDHLQLMGTKNGCGSGRCGACTVVVGGEAVRACTYKAARAAGKAVTTIEGLAINGELHPLQRAFIEKGAVQCGYFTPGMIMAAKALLDGCPDPTDAQIRQALKHNLCRCTGYVKINEAVRAAAAELGGHSQPEQPDQTTGKDVRAGKGLTVVGKRIPREESLDRVTGVERYTGDLERPGMLHAAALRSEYPHARILRVDVSRARQMPGVAAVLTAEDVPGTRNHGMVQKDWPVLAYEKVRYPGDALAVVAAESPEQAQAALAGIEVDYQPLPVISSPEEGLAEGAQPVHTGGNILMHIQFGKGDINRGFAQSDRVMEHTYRTPTGEHAFLEPEAALAEPDPATGGVIVYVGSQVPFEDREQIAASLAKYRIPSILDTPKITAIIVEHPCNEGPYGAKGVGEITCMHTAPAICNAVRCATGVGIFSLPVEGGKLRRS